MALVNVKEMYDRVQKIFEKAGLNHDDSVLMADVLTDAQMKGITTHGYIRVKKYVDCIKSGGIQPAGELRIENELPSWAKVDGRGGLGIVIACKAADLAIKKAKETGVGIVNVYNSHHLGPAGYYAAKCADAGMLGMTMSNGDVLVAATGSREKTIGNNPFAYAVPAGKYDKILYDVAMSMGSDMKIIQFEQEGKKVPDGWMLDSMGCPSNNPSDYMAGGVLLPFGGYKGYGLALMVEAFAALLSGSAVTQNVHAWNNIPGTSGNVGHFIMALDISKMCDVDEYIKRTESIIDEIKGSKKAEGIDEIFYPGEKEQIARNACMTTGVVEVADSVMELIEMAEASCK